ncbi:MAG: hypothetical protein ACI9JL_002242 [Paracoccaceae bacterium]|jgi:uncharacterized protein
MADITPQVPQGRQLIQGYGGGGFRIAGVAHTSSVIVLPDETIAWQAASFDDISVAGLAPLLTENNGVEVLLIGCGPRMGMPIAEIRDALKAYSIVPEWMDTGAACRTFNVLLAEDRAVAAALIAVD